jgi:periplasmic divalent cation tolerance protein
MVFCTCSTRDEAQVIARSIVENRLAACVNILPGVQSVFRWEGKVDISNEFLLFIKTTSNRFEVLRDHIVAMHSYQVPEVIAVPVQRGLEPYLRWISDSVE